MISEYSIQCQHPCTQSFLLSMLTLRFSKSTIEEIRIDQSDQAMDQTLDTARRIHGLFVLIYRH